MSRIHQLKAVQKLPVSREQAWDFFSAPSNLAAITPPFLNLKNRNGNFKEEMYEGQVILYRLRPFFNIPLNWMTEITHVQKPVFFVDEQRRGPYALWHHEHHFEEIEGGVAMTDLVHYCLPFGLLGDVAYKLGISKKLRAIFAYRYQKLVEKFGGWQGASMDISMS